MPPDRTCSRRLLLALVALLALWGVLSACDGGSAGRAQLALAGETMGTTYHVKVVQAPADTDPEALQAKIDELLVRINREMSTYDPSSELSRFNQSRSTDWVAVSAGLVQVVQQARRVSLLTAGAFDVTVGPLVNLWGFGPEARRDEPPPDAAIAAAQARVGYQRLHVRDSPPALRKEQADIYVDLSAIAKGYGVDQVAEYLDSQGIANYLVEIGGELRGKGRNVRGEHWIIGIEKPAPGERSVEQLIYITDQGVATSGDYRNFFERDGQRYSHEIDPRTGRPIAHELVSVTVVSHSAMGADALATALLVMGPEAGFRLAEEQRLAALFITVDDGGFRARASPAFDPYLAR